MQAPRAWYEHIDRHLQGMGFVKSVADANLYYFMVGGVVLILVLYVDTLLLTCSLGLTEECKRNNNKVGDVRLGAHALLSRHGGVVDRWGDFP